MDFEIVSEIIHIKTFASGTGVKDRIRLEKQYGAGKWRKKKGIADVRLIDGTLHRA